MKKLILLIHLICSLLSLKVFCQNTTITPAFIQIPATPTAPGCGIAADKGKQYFNTTSNKMFYCDGTAWVEYAAVVPTAFMAYTGLNDTINVGIPEPLTLDIEIFDKGGNFSAPYFSVPQDGVYHFDVSVKWEGGSTISTYVRTTLEKCDKNKEKCVVVAANTMENQERIHQTFGVNVNLAAGETVKVMVYQTNFNARPRHYAGVDAGGNILTFFSGYLVK